VSYGEPSTAFLAESVLLKAYLMLVDGISNFWGLLLGRRFEATPAAIAKNLRLILHGSDDACTPPRDYWGLSDKLEIEGFKVV
jgi:hypothetical protein